MPKITKLFSKNIWAFSLVREQVMPEQSLKELFSTINLLSYIDEDVAISGIAVDSRLVESGDLFFAIVDRVDRYDYIDQVIEKGAAAVVGIRPHIDQDIPYIQVADDRAALLKVSAAFYGYPSRNLTMIGVTGTDGKTTTCNLIYEILKAAGIQAGMISTVNAIIGDQTLDTGFHVTTPEAMDVQKYLAQMVEAGLTHVVMELTSHGLAAKRVMPSEFDIGVVTNITHEHIDFHGTYEDYRAAKTLLFEGLSQSHIKEAEVIPMGVINRDDISFEHLNAEVRSKKVSYGLSQQADVVAREIRDTPAGLKFHVAGPDFDLPFECNLTGDYNVSNCLAAISAAVVGLGLNPKAAQEGIKALEGVPGRMEKISMGQEFLAIVDFAHTPNALERALKAGRRISKGRLIVVFGSAGLRDREKRRMMAETSARLADLTILTAEDPRTESLDAILAEMAFGAETQEGVEGETFWLIPDRGEAIRFAVQQAEPGDLVMALGKGHEQSMCFIETEYPWDDRTAMRAALAEQLKVKGPDMPYLPTQD